MCKADSPISGQQSRAMWLVEQLRSHLESPGAEIVGAASAVGWYMRHGHSLGLPREVLERSLEEMPDLQQIAASLSLAEVEAGKPPPKFLVGQHVEVIVNAKNLTYHRGVVSELTWHHKDAKWIYILSENGKRVSKRYEASDLRPVEG